MYWDYDPTDQEFEAYFSTGASRFEYFITRSRDQDEWNIVALSHEDELPLGRYRSNLAARKAAEAFEIWMQSRLAIQAESQKLLDISDEGL